MHSSDDGAVDRPPLTEPLAVITILKSIVGGGILALPHTFAKVHTALALLIMVVVAALGYAGTLRLVECKVQLMAYNSLPISEDEDMSTHDTGKNEDELGLGAMGMVSKRIFGQPGIIAVMVGALSAQIGIAVVYTYVIVDTVYSLLGGSVPNAWLYSGLTCILCLMSLLRGLASLAWLSGVALLVYVYVLVALLRFGIGEISAGTSPPIEDTVFPLCWEGLGQFLGIVICTYEGIVVSQYVFEDMQTLSVVPFGRALGVSYVIAFLLYSFVGSFGYAVYGSSAKDIIYQSFPGNSADVTICEIVLCVVLLITYVLQLYPCFSVLEFFASQYCSSLPSSGKGSEDSTSTETLVKTIVIRWPIVILATILAILVPNLSTVMTYIGGFSYSYIGLILPAAAHMKLNCSTMHCSAWVLDVLILMLGVFAVVLTLLRV